MLKKAIPRLLLLTILGVLLSKQIANPIITWDGLGYMACILKLDGETDTEKIHQTVYSEIEKNTPGYRYEHLTIGSYYSPHEYREAMINDYNAFNEQLPFYSIKFLYVLSCYGLYKSGVSLSLATIIPSVISYFVLALFFFNSIKINLKFTYVALGLTLLVFIMPSFTDVGIISTPDALASMLMFLSSYLFLFYNSKIILISVLVLASLARPDNAIFGICLLSLDFLMSEKKLLHILRYCLAVTLLVSVALVLKSSFENPGWKVWFHHSFIKHLTHPLTEETPDFGIFQYLKILLKGIISTVLRLKFPILLLAFFTYILFRTKRITFNIRALKRDKTTILLISILTTLVFRFLLYPSLPERMFFPYFLMLLVILSSIFTQSPKGIKSVEL